MVLSTQAGLPLFPEPIRYDLLRDNAKLGAMFAAASPCWEPGTAHGYHAVSIGPLTSELLRRVDPKGRTLGKFFDEEIAKPFGKCHQHEKTNALFVKCKGGGGTVMLWYTKSVILRGEG